MAILVTGGAGYVGSHTVRLLGEQGRDVVVLDSLELGRRDVVLGGELVVGTIHDQALVARLLTERDVDAVIHFAAYKEAGESMRDPGRYFENNVGGSLALLRALGRAGVRRFVFSSSCAVYGSPEVSPVDETHPLHPASPYGASKLMVEQMLPWFDGADGLRSVSLRYFNAAGASLDARIGEDWSVTSNLIPVASKAICGRSGPVPVFGTDYPTPDGTAVRDYVHVLDLADAHSLALAYLEGGGPSSVCNLGTGQGSSVMEVLAHLERVAGKPVPTVAAPRRPGDPAAVWSDNRRARELLGWTPRFGLPEMVSSAWRWHTRELDDRRA